MISEWDMRITVNAPNYSQYDLHFSGYRAEEKLESVNQNVLSLVVETSALFSWEEHHKNSNHLCKLYAKFWNLFLT